MVMYEIFVRITSFSLSVETGEPGVRQMLAVGLDDARVEVRYILQVSIHHMNENLTPCYVSICHFTLFQVMHLKSDYRAEDEDSCDRELERFLHYVSII